MVTATSASRLATRASAGARLGTDVSRGHFLLLAGEIKRFQNRAMDEERSVIPDAPPGMPIGDQDEEALEIR